MSTKCFVEIACGQRDRFSNSTTRTSHYLRRYIFPSRPFPVSRSQPKDIHFATDQSVPGCCQVFPGLVLRRFSDPGFQITVNPASCMYCRKLWLGRESVEEFAHRHGFNIRVRGKQCVQLPQENVAVMLVSFPTVFSIQNNRNQIWIFVIR